VNPPTRPLLRWHGGKWRLGPWIVAHLPRHQVYIEPFGGAASVLLRKPRSYAEIYNDLDGDVVNLFRVLRSDRAGELVRALELTPFARTEFEDAYERSDDPVEEARRLVVRSFMGFGSDGFNRAVRTGFRSTSNRSGTTPAHDWANYPKALLAIIERLNGVVIERRPALEVMFQHDRADALHYLDPPYMPGTRSGKSRKTGERYHAYTHEMTLDDHRVLLSSLPAIKGAVVISGYETQLYDEALLGWRRVTIAAMADGAAKRTEVLWLNARAADQIAGELAFGDPGDAVP
jgi:DNA adenine methylase